MDHDETFDQYAPIVDAAVETALRAWFDEHVRPGLQPNMVAAGEEDAEDDRPLNIEAILLAAASWGLLYDKWVTPTMEALTAARVAASLTNRGIPIEELPTRTTARTPDAALDTLDNAGIDTTNARIIIRTPSWPDYIDRHATTRRNMVAAMPETLYRDLVNKLSTATKQGAPPWERSRLTRQFLSWDAEGGYQQWMNRAHRISRTETNTLINAADLQAARTERAHTGAEMDKVWVASTDARTRDSHYRADGQRVPIDGRFRIGGRSADHPGDSSLPPEDSINCRCSVIYLRPDEPLPGETDRQTERTRSDGTRRNPQTEINRRTARGVTRDRDDAQQSVTAAAEGETMARTKWSGILAPINKPTGDGRIFDADATVTFRDFPLPLMFQKATGEGHDTAVVVGKITDAVVDESGIRASGEFFATPEAQEAANLVNEGVIRPSVDLADMVTEYEALDADGNTINFDDEMDPSAITSEMMHIKGATVIAATLVAKPAFGEAKILLGGDAEAPADAEAEERALTASVMVSERHWAPADAFADPGLKGPQALTVTDEGRVYGHLALWGTEHVGMPGRRVTPPRSATDYALFHVSSVDTDEGPVSVGRLTVGTGHADARAGAHATASHYDQTGSTWAYVKAGEDDHGIWVAGVTNPDASEEAVRAGASAPLSGDWRNVGGNLELVAALSVNTPGFPVPRAYSLTKDESMSLVASGVVPPRSRADDMAAAVAEGLRLHEQRKERERAAADEAERAAAARRMAAGLLASRVR